MKNKKIYIIATLMLLLMLIIPNTMGIQSTPSQDHWSTVTKKIGASNDEFEPIMPDEPIVTHNGETVSVNWEPAEGLPEDDTTGIPTCSAFVPYLERNEYGDPIRLCLIVGVRYRIMGDSIATLEGNTKAIFNGQTYNIPTYIEVTWESYQNGCYMFLIGTLPVIGIQGVTYLQIDWAWKENNLPICHIIRTWNMMD